MISNLLELTGTDLVVTSAYNTRANGFTEKFNGTIAGAIRKHANGDDIDWPKCINFVLLAYRSKIQSSTKYTPNELIFRRSLNTFDRWSDEMSNDEIAAIAQRAEKIEKFKKDKRLRKYKEQKKIKQSSVTEEPLEKGTNVFLKAPSLFLKKLEPRYRGPYVIESKTKKGN